MRISTPRIAAAVLTAGLLTPATAGEVGSDRFLAAARLQDAGNHREAIEIFQQLREIDPRDPQVLYGLALSLYAIGDYRESTRVGADLLAAQERAPADLFVIIGTAHGRLREWETSEKILNAGLVLWPDSQALRIQHAISLEGLGRFDEAVVELESCLKSSPYEATLWRALGDALTTVGAPGRAFAAYVRSLTLENDEARSREVAANLWSVLFQGAAGASSSDAAERAETKGLALIAALRRDALWSAQSDARYFTYALDTSLRLVSALHGRETHSLFWGPFVMDYFDEVRGAGHMEALAYEVRRATGDPDVVRWQAQNPKKVRDFRDWSERWSVKWSEVAQRRPQGS
jgi:tetratricopeptide (TPR) repeat protein